MEEFILSTIQSHRALSFIPNFLLENKQVEFYLVGGAIRDIILKRKVKEHDFDFVVTGMAPEKIEQWFESHGEINLVGERFGVYKFMPSGYNSAKMSFIDIALPRTEHVAKGSLGGYHDFDIQSDPNIPIEQDLNRRDFTINAMAFRIRDGVLLDPLNGLMDLKTKTIRAVGNPTQRFEEDISRILRGIRFAAELEFTIENSTSQAIKMLMPEINKLRKNNELQEYVVPRETVGSELAKALSRNPALAIAILEEHNGLQTIFPHVYEHTKNEHNYLSPLFQTVPNELTVVIALLLRSIETNLIKETFRLSGLDTLARTSSQRIEIERVLWLIQRIKDNVSVQEVVTMPCSSFERWFMNRNGQQLMRCFELVGKTDIAKEAKYRRKEIENRWLVDHDESIAPLISGQDLLTHGIKEGPDVRKWLDLVRDLQLEGYLMSREEALKWVGRKIRNQKSLN